MGSWHCYGNGEAKDSGCNSLSLSKHKQKWTPHLRLLHESSTTLHVEGSIRKLSYQRALSMRESRNAAMLARLGLNCDQKENNE